MENKITEGSSKSIIINGDTHNRLKIFCKSRGLKIGAVVEDLIKLYLSDIKSIQKLIDDKK